MTNQTFENLKTNNNWRRKYLCWQPLHWWQYSTTEGKYEISQTIIYFIQTTSSSSTLWSSSSVSSSVSSSDSAALLLLHLYILLFNVLFSHALVNNLQCHTQGHRIHCTTQSYYMYIETIEEYYIFNNNFINIKLLFYRSTPNSNCRNKFDDTIWLLVLEMYKPHIHL